MDEGSNFISSTLHGYGTGKRKQTSTLILFKKDKLIFYSLFFMIVVDDDNY